MRRVSVAIPVALGPLIATGARVIIARTKTGIFISWSVAVLWVVGPWPGSVSGVVVVAGPVAAATGVRIPRSVAALAAAAVAGPVATAGATVVVAWARTWPILTGVGIAGPVAARLSFAWPVVGVGSATAWPASRAAALKTWLKSRLLIRRQIMLFFIFFDD
jgi:hypothetical protein